ncbi:MAG: glycoside hydrolase family 3 C-terminal domain-containing protein [Bryobacteraceae bacterium]|nr:glycoside hydrolase family 3 C-terminal domain-containing protein [Bryobacteraceae bacterium]
MLLAVLCLALLCPVVYAAAPPPAGKTIVDQWMKQLTLAEKAAQLVFVPIYGDNPHPRSKAWRATRSAITDLKAGGLILLNRVRGGVVQRAEPYQTAAFLNRVQKLSKLPLLIGGDFERGASMRFNGVPQYPHLMAFGAANDPALTRAFGLATAREARALGFHWVYAPVSDVNNNPDNPIINIRSFGESPQLVAAHVEAFIQGARSDPANRVLLTVKHFPGHGDTATDSHLGLGVVSASKERLEQVELTPFRAAIAAGVDSVMTAHLSVPALEPEPIPATVSKNIITGLLKESLGFKGIISTDAMDMQGLAKLYPPGEAAVRALEAGVDVLLVPADARAAVNAVVEAVRTKRIPRARLEESVRKVLAAKVSMGLHRRRLVNLEGLGESLDSPEENDIAASAAARAITLVKNDGGLIPLDKAARGCFFVLSGNRFSTQGRDLTESLRAAAPNAMVALLDPLLPAETFKEHAGTAEPCSYAAVFTFVAAAAYQGSVSLPGGYPGFVESLIATGKPVAMISMGNPYLLRAFPKVSAYVAAFSTAAPSEQAVLKALFGEAPVSGKLPVSIPGIAGLGFGIVLEQKPVQ